MNWMDLWLPLMAIFLSLGVGAYITEYFLGVALALQCRGLEGAPGGYHPLRPIQRLALRLSQQRLETECPDRLNWQLAPAIYFALAALGLAVVPWSAGFAPVDLATTVVIWGAVEVLATVVIFLYGWSANAHMPLQGGYRYVALGLSYMLVSMFVLIGVALPAESLQFSTIVESQRPLWNVVRQPLGLPLFLVVGLGLTFWGPLNFAGASDLAGGVEADTSGALALVWEFARRCMLVAFAFVAATAFLGGWLGPVLPGPVWLILKTLAVLALMIWLGQNLALITPEKFVTLAWVVLLPLSFVDLIWAGVLALW